MNNEMKHTPEQESQGLGADWCECGMNLIMHIHLRDRNFYCQKNGKYLIDQKTNARLMFRPLKDTQTRS